MPKDNYCKVVSPTTDFQSGLEDNSDHSKRLPEQKRLVCPKIVVQINNKALFSSFETEIENQLASTALSPNNAKSCCVPQITQATDECTSISSDNKQVLLIKKKRTRGTQSDDIKKNKKKTKEKNMPIKEEYKLNQSHAKKMIDNVYQDSDYYNDLLTILRNKQHRFMYRNFSSSYNKECFYKHIKMRCKSRKNAHLKFDDEMIEHQGLRVIEHNTTDELKAKIPLCKWKPSFENRISNEVYRQFINRMKDIWLVDICEMRIEYLLEYLMIHNYKTEACFENIDECMMYALQKIRNIPITATEVNSSSNKYALRKKLKFG